MGGVVPTTEINYGGVTLTDGSLAARRCHSVPLGARPLASHFPYVPHPLLLCLPTH